VPDRESPNQSPSPSQNPQSFTTPTGTYRLQFRAEFGFEAAAELAGYLADLGISHVYTSPILQAVPGSTHGYDVVDHGRISEDLGGEEAFRAMAARFREHGIGLIVDVVPNHMAIPAPETMNRPFWDVLREGEAGRGSRWFDIDWSSEEVVLPVLGKPYRDVQADLLGDGDVLRYFEHVFPLPGHYRLAYWKDGEPNYRRFFDISTLIGLRVEDPEIFEATHAVLLALVAEGLIDGLRIDHPDGLTDPRGYLRMLAERTGGAWTVVEKILLGDEILPADWPCAGTTGYDSLGMIGGLFNDPAGERPLTDLYVAGTGGPAEFEPVERAAKRFAAEQILRPEVDRLHGVLVRILPEEDPAALRDALVELVTAMPVYRAYVVPGEAAPASARDILGKAWPDPLVARVAGLALGDEGRDELRDEFVVRFQQTAAPMMAKGVEDTAFYRWSRQAALNEVGGDPARFAVSPGEFHEFCARLGRDWPATMTTLSTHDTKRQEDVRARLAVLTELPAEWAEALASWGAAGRSHGGETRSGRDSPLEPDLDQLMWQTIVGAWPLDAVRLGEYLTKAMREAKTRTSWKDPDQGYEEAVLGYAAELLADAGLTDEIEAFVVRLAAAARVNSLGQKLVQLTMSGVPDVYQGCELLGLSLVDPDNRRPVDYNRRQSLLKNPDGSLDAEKLLVTSRALWLRREHPDWFSAGYTALEAVGDAADHVVAFRRGGAITVVTRLSESLGDWGSTTLSLPDGVWRDCLTDGEYRGAVRIGDLLGRGLPVALLTVSES
jgi:malto-oligosyltrehalose synthase